MQPNPAPDEQLSWERACPAAITTDVLWKLDAYRAAMFLLHLSEGDCRTICARHPNDDIARQLLRAAGSVGANLGESTVVQRALIGSAS